MAIITLTSTGLNQPTGWVVLERYGLPIVFLAAVLYFGYKLFWPTFLKQIEFSQQVLEKQVELAAKTSERSEARFERQSAEFTRSIESQGLNIAKAFADMHTRFDRLEKLDREREGRK